MSSGASSVHLPALLEAEFNVLGEHVFCDDEIGIDWREIREMPGEIELKLRDRQNEKLLRALTLFEEHDETKADESERAEFYRLEGKVDIVLDLLSALLREKEPAARVRSARFNSRGLCWDAQKPVDEGKLLDVDCLLLPQWPLPLKLFARVVESAPRGEGFRVCTRVEGLSGVSRDWFGKLVFRRHRRNIAHRRARS